MAQQDVRTYLNGLLLDLRETSLRCVATDGHRLALCEAELPAGAQTRKQIILPRKGVLEAAAPARRRRPRGRAGDRAATTCACAARM
jgi:DNA polymerase III sliding clamp (beta) subunit (PCNA family)